MAGELIKTPAPLAMLFLIVLGLGLALKGVAANSQFFTVAGAAIVMLGIYNWIQWSRAGKRDRGEK